VNVLALGGSTRRGSRSAAVLSFCASILEQWGHQVTQFGPGDLVRLPFYGVLDVDRPAEADAVRQLLDALVGADALVVCTPVYQSTFSGLVKNGLDHVHELPILLDGVPFAPVAVAGSVAQARIAGEALATVVRSFRHEGAVIQPVALAESGVSDAGVPAALAAASLTVALRDLSQAHQDRTERQEAL